MSMASINLKPIVAAILILLAFFSEGQAQEADLTDESELLEALAQADEAQALRLDRQLQALWSKSGSASADLLLKRGRDALEEDDTRAAIEHLTALTDHAPEFAQGWAERARTFYALDLYGPAISDLEHVLALNPQHFDAIMGLAVMLDQMGRAEDAYEAYLQVKAIHPHQAGLTEALERLAPQVRGKSL